MDPLESDVTAVDESTQEVKRPATGHSGGLIFFFALLIAVLGAWGGYAFATMQDTASSQSSSKDTNGTYQAGYDAAMKEARAKLEAQGLSASPPGEVEQSSSLYGSITALGDNTLTLQLANTDPLSDPEQVTVAMTGSTEIIEVLMDDAAPEPTFDEEGLPVLPEPEQNLGTVADLAPGLWVTVVPTEESVGSNTLEAATVTYTTDLNAPVIPPDPEIPDTDE